MIVIAHRQGVNKTMRLHQIPLWDRLWILLRPHPRFVLLYGGAR